jgi:hypothetical protein
MSASPASTNKSTFLRFHDAISTGDVEFARISHAC